MRLMTILFAPAVLAASLVAAGPSWAAEFTATVESGVIKVYSTSDKEMTCNLTVPFSYIYQGTGKRELTKTFCPRKEITVSEKSEVCSVEHPDIVDAKIEGPVMAACK